MGGIISRRFVTIRMVGIPTDSIQYIIHVMFLLLKLTKLGEVMV